MDLGIYINNLEFEQIGKMRYQMHFNFDNDQMAVSIVEDKDNKEQGVSQK